MLFVLVGPSYVGKKTALNHFISLYSFRGITPYTTKPYSRDNREIAGINYHYVKQSDFVDIENEDFVYDRPFDGEGHYDDAIYAYRKTDLKMAIESESNFMIHASVGNAEKIRYMYINNIKSTAPDEKKERLYILFLNFESDLSLQLIKNRYSFGSDVSQFEEEYKVKKALKKSLERDFHHAEKEIKYYKEHTDVFDYCIKSDKTYDICRQLEDFILPKLVVSPTAPDKIPGPLSDLDILYMNENRKKDRLEIRKDNRTLKNDELKGMLCGCGLHITLSNTIRTIKRSKIPEFVDMASDEAEIEILLSKIFPEIKISTGYILKPKETILCSSQEYVQMPQDVYAIVSSKFSYTQLGLSIELGTSIIHSGHTGKVHFQIQNNTDNYICIYPDIEVAQLIFYRTVQPSSTKYGENQEGAHGYDKDSISPISKFRTHNNALEKAKKPKTRFLQRIAADLNNKIIASIIGLIVCVALVTINFSEIEKWIGNIIVPFFSNITIVHKCLLIAFVGSILNVAYYTVGVIVIAIIRKLLYFLRSNTRTD